MKKYGFIGILLICSILLSSCKCKHEWVDATCTEAGICRKCNAVGEPNGHIWEDATCLLPKTCSVCGVTEGDPLGHDYFFFMDNLGHSCSRCGKDETDPAASPWGDYGFINHQGKRKWIEISGYSLSDGYAYYNRNHGFQHMIELKEDYLYYGWTAVCDGLWENARVKQVWTWSAENNEVANVNAEGFNSIFITERVVTDEMLILKVNGEEGGESWYVLEDMIDMENIETTYNVYGNIDQCIYRFK